MSWQAGVLVVLAATLLGGFAWYERSRPPSQIVALVAALAALAVAGRIAFSPIPNVAPTTDIALLSGFALGSAPGFAVGALAGLVSNFWLGQGPWTPWQMAGWGMTGLLGAGLAAATGRRVGRLGLAAACALAGLAYGALLDLSLMVTYGGEQSLDRFLAISARGVPFNIAHAAGNAALALVAGPALSRMLLRYRRRFEFAWAGRAPASARAGRRPAAGAACALCALLVAAPLLLEGAPAQGIGPRSATAWLKRAQNADGGYGSDPGAPSSPVMTGWACLGLEAAGKNPLDLRRQGNTPISYLRRNAGEIRSTGDLERTILVLAGAGVNPRRFGGDLIARLRARRAADGSWPGQVNPTAFGILALAATGGDEGLSASAAWLRSAQNSDGGWGFASGADSDPDSTGAALQALAAAGGSGEPISAGVAWLRGAQGQDGGFAISGGAANAQSTAWAVQGLIAAGTPPDSIRGGGHSPLDFMRSVQAPDGHYRYSAASDQTKVWVTGQALAAASGKAFPLSRVARAATGKRPKAGSDTGEVVPADGGAGGALEPADPARAKKPEGAPSTPPGPASAPADPVGLEPASGERGDGDGGSPEWPILAAIGLLAAVAGGTWALQRRRPR